MEVIVMRELNKMEMDFVSGGLVCTPGNSIGGFGDPDGVGTYLIGVYEGLVAATSHVIERVANAF
jgi:energy-converting hydrogenase Eha subunit B